MASVESEPELRPSITSRRSSEEQLESAQSNDTESNMGQNEESQRLIPPQMKDDVSPLRVPVFQAPRDVMGSSQPTSHSTNRYQVASSDDGSPKRLRSNCTTTTGAAANGSNADRNHVLEPRNDLDRYATAQPASRGTLLDSVVSQLMTAGSSLHRPRPGSQDSKQALQQYLRRRSSEKIIAGQDEVPALQCTDIRSRPLSWQAQIQHETSGMVRDVKDRPPTPFTSLPSHEGEVSGEALSNRFDRASAAPLDSANVASPAVRDSTITPALVPERSFSLASSSSAGNPIENALLTHRGEESGHIDGNGSTSDLISVGPRDSSVSDIRQGFGDEVYLNLPSSKLALVNAA